MKNTNNKQYKPPNPGSGKALELGCKCPIFDNGRGRGCGWIDADGEVLFWINPECEIHNS